MADLAVAGPAGVAAPAVKARLGRDEWILRAFTVVIGLYLLVALALPLGLMLAKSLQSGQGAFVGLANYRLYFATPALAYSIYNSFVVAILSTLITVPLAFLYAYALTRSCLPLPGVWKTIALIPILVPSMLPGIALVYLFGNQGWLKALMLGHSIYGPIGIVMAEVFFTFPHALLIMVTALSLTDARLYEAAIALRTSRPRMFFTVTLPGARYGLISATFVVFTMVITDFGAPKIIGGQYSVLATDVYKQVIGQQNFAMGAVVSVVLLIPAAFAFVIDRAARRRQVALLSARAVPYAPKPSRRFDLAMVAYCAVVGVFLVGMMAISQYAALVRFWPYNLALTLQHYDFDRLGTIGWAAYYNSIRLSLYTALAGTGLVFVGAYLVEKARGFTAGRAAFQFLAMTPMAVPGLVLGPRLHLLLQPPGQPAQRALPDDGPAGDQHHRPLLHGGPPDRAHRAQADGPRVRDGVGLAEAAGLQDLLAGDGAGLPAGDPRHRHLPLRQRDEHGVGRRLPLGPRDRAGLGGGAGHGRRRPDRGGGGDGDDDLLHQRRRPRPPPRAEPLAGAAHPGLAPPVARGR